MLTARAWWLGTASAVLVAFAVVWRTPNIPLALVGLTMLLWLCAQWLAFAIRARVVIRRLRLVRELRDEHGPVTVLWSRRPFEVRVSLRCPSAIGLPYVSARDRVPFAAILEDGNTRVEGALTAEQPFELSYRVRYPVAGTIRFEGVNLELTDLQGLFVTAAFVASPAVYRVLPPLADSRGRTATAKRHNLLPPPGIHRLRRPGSGSELLDIRDYLPGDPPKMIAWRISARRERLMTKEFESEVPVRCTLFIDTSNSVRLGPRGRNPLSQIIEVAATIAQAAAGSRDLAGLCLFDESNATYVRPARGARHLARLLNLLTEAAALSPLSPEAEEQGLLPLAHAFAQEVYPELMRPRINRFPFWLAWLAPRRAATIRHPTATQRAYPWLPCLLAAYALAGVPLLIFGASWLLYGIHFRVPRFWMLDLIVFTLVSIAMVAAFLALPALVLFPAQRRRYRWRKQLAALLAMLYDLGPGGVGLLMEDGTRLGEYLQRFLGDHHVPFTLPLYDRHGRYLFSSDAKIGVLADSLLGAIRRGHDNELFVLLADFLELREIGPLLKAVEVALARHHRVMVICPWPTGIPVPRSSRGGQSAEEGSGASGTFDAELLQAAPSELEVSLREATTQRLHRAFRQIRRRFARLGVPMIWAPGGEATRLVLDRLEQMRSVGGKR